MIAGQKRPVVAGHFVDELRISREVFFSILRNCSTVAVTLSVRASLRRTLPRRGIVAVVVHMATSTLVPGANSIHSGC